MQPVTAHGSTREEFAPPSRARRFVAVAVGFGIPLVALVGVMPAIAGIPLTIFGVPLLFLWIFLCFPLTTVCLATAWHLTGGRDEAEQGDEQ